MKLLLKIKNGTPPMRKVNSVQCFYYYYLEIYSLFCLLYYFKALLILYFSTLQDVATLYPIVSTLKQFSTSKQFSKLVKLYLIDNACVYRLL